MGHLSATTNGAVYNNINNHIVPVAKDVIQCQNGSAASAAHDDPANDSDNINNNNNHTNHNMNSVVTNGKLNGYKNHQNGNGTVLNGAGVKDISSENPEEFNYFGYKVYHKLKWPNIFGIFLIHGLFIYILINGRPIPTKIYTYIWGK